MKNPLTPAGIEPATFQFVAQHLNHCATAVPDFAVGKLHKTNFKLGMCLTGPKLDVKNKKKAFVYRACFVKLRRALNLLYFPNPNNTKETIPVLVVF